MSAFRTLLMSLLFVGCQQPPEEALAEARAQLSAGDWEAAADLAQAGLNAGAEGTVAWRLELVALEAAARAGQGEQVERALKRLGAAHDQALTPGLYLQTATQLKEAGDPVGAVTVLDAGAQRSPGDPGLLAALSRSGQTEDPDTLRKLISMGYISK